MTVQTAEHDRNYARWAGLLIIAILVFRIIALLFNASGLHGDEAQYWAWAQDPAFGYYSKPPLIAWIIWVTTAIFGDAEWAVRLASPFLHSAAAALTFLTARRLYEGRVGLLACALYLLAPGIALSASLISTDAALLLCIALFLYAWTRLRESASWRWTIVLGLALGFGFLAKYAMMYVLPAFFVALLFERKTRKAILNVRGLVAGLIAGLTLLPNLVWNAQNSFATLVHTTDNANLSGGMQLNPDELLEFLAGQLGVFGPVTFILLLLALWQVRRNRADFTLWLGLLVLTPLLVICGQALISRANANWAAAAYASAPILLAQWAVGTRWREIVAKIGIGLNLILGVVPAIVLTSPNLTNQIGFANSVKRQRGWPETVEAIRSRYGDDTFDAIAVDNRLMFYAISYYDIASVGPLFMWRYEPRLNSHAELTRALPQDDHSVLIISYYFETYEPYFERDFETIESLGRFDIDLGGGKVRRLKAYKASGYKGPVPRD